jgi:F-type H+-transporting ATPase subunit a
MEKKKRSGCASPLIIVLAVVFILLTIYGLIIGPIGQKILGHYIGPSFLYQGTPEPALEPGVLFVAGSFPITNTMITVWITVVLVALLTYFAFRRPKMVPTGLQKVMEYIYNALLDFCISVAGEKDGRRFFPFVSTIFLFVIFNAYLGLLPFFGDAFFMETHYYLTVTGIGVSEEAREVALLRAANTDINVPLALALFAWISIEVFGLKAHGFIAYAKKFINTKRLGKGLKGLFSGKAKSAISDILFGVIDLFVGFLEAISEFIRIVSFTFRLFGNMTAGEVLILIVAFLAPFMVGVFVYGLETLVGFVQALIFGGLTLVWMTTAVAKEHGEEEHS